MKLSQAIETVIREGIYSKQDEFMCCVLRDHYGDAMREQLQDILQVVFPTKRRTNPLINSLYDLYNPLGGISSEGYHEFWDNQFTMTKQWYCWLVYDLKRKGL